MPVVIGISLAVRRRLTERSINGMETVTDCDRWQRGAGMLGPSIWIDRQVVRRKRKEDEEGSRGGKEK
jgi:hypothetical protein